MPISRFVKEMSSSKILFAHNAQVSDCWLIKALVRLEIPDGSDIILFSSATPFYSQLVKETRVSKGDKSSLEILLLAQVNTFWLT